MEACLMVNVGVERGGEKDRRKWRTCTGSVERIRLESVDRSE